jgi:AhpC/TSA family
MGLYDAHRDHRDKFEIIAFHDGTVKDFAELDEKLKPVAKNTWRGRSLPFPILLDATGQTIKDYGVRAFPTTILIDPDGKLVGEAGEDALDAKLPPLPVAERVARALDRDVAYGFDNPALSAVTTILGPYARLAIRFDPDALKAAGVTPDTTVPLTMTGSVTLRSWLDLMLGPFDLTWRADDTGLVIVRRESGVPPPAPSEPQRACAKRIAERLDQRVTFDFQGKTLAEVAKFFEGQTTENFVLDPAARRAGRLDPKAPVTGSGTNVPLRDGLERLLAPLGVTVVVRDEVVVLTVPEKK